LSNRSSDIFGDQKDLLTTKKTGQFPEDDDFGKNKKSVIKTTSSLAQSNVIKKPTEKSTINPLQFSL